MIRRYNGGFKYHEDYSNPIEGKAFDNSIIGAMGEMAVAQEFNLYWNDQIGRETRRCRCGWGDRGSTRHIDGPGTDLGIRAVDVEKNRTCRSCS